MNSKLTYLEGLRGIAALMVVLNHIQLAFAEDSLTNLLTLLEDKTGSYIISHVLHGSINVFFSGDLAVHIFWFLSAYVISIKLFKDNDTSYLVKVISKRYVRLAIPVFFSVVFAYLLMEGNLMSNFDLKLKDSPWVEAYYYFDPDFLVAIQSAIWNTFFDPGGSVTYNSVLWTMNPELYGSLICFGLFAVLRKTLLRFVVYILVAFWGIIQIKFWLTSFMLGFFLCDLDYSPARFRWYVKVKDSVFRLPRLNLIAFVTLLILGGFPNYFGYFFTGISGLIVLVLLNDHRLQAFFSSKKLVWLGEHSFSIYLLHFPILCSFSSLIYLNLALPTILKILIAGISTVIMTIGIAILFTRYVDNLAISMSKRFGDFVSSSLTKK